MTGTADEYTSNTVPSANLRYTFGYVNSLYNAPYTDGLNSVISTEESRMRQKIPGNSIQMPLLQQGM